MKSNMRPHFSIYDSAYMVLTNSKSFPKFSLLHALLPKLSYLKNLLVRELGVFVSFSQNWICSSLGNHVLRVVLVSAEEKMERITTGRIVALMKNTLLFWDRTVMVGPSKPMTCDRNVPSIPEFFSKAVSRPANRTAPLPASCVLANFDALYESNRNHNHIYDNSTGGCQ